MGWYRSLWIGSYHHHICILLWHIRALYPLSLWPFLLCLSLVSISGYHLFFYEIAHFHSHCLIPNVPKLYEVFHNLRQKMMIVTFHTAVSLTALFQFQWWSTRYSKFFVYIHGYRFLWGGRRFGCLEISLLEWTDNSSLWKIEPLVRKEGYPQVLSLTVLCRPYPKSIRIPRDWCISLVITMTGSLSGNISMGWMIYKVCKMTKS